MDLGFIIIALAIILPFALLVLARASRCRRESEAMLSKLLFRAGIKTQQANAIKTQMESQMEKAWYLWLIVQFKRAGIVKRVHVVRLIAVQVVLLLISVFGFAVLLNNLTENQVLLLSVLPFLPSAFVAFKINQRQKELRVSFPAMLDSVVRSIQSGYSIDGAIGAVGEDMTGPLAEEMRAVTKQLSLGITMREILREFQYRVGLPEAQFFVITLIIQRETGGQLAAILAELSKLMRRREMFQGKLKTLTAESRFTAWFIGGAPVLYIGYKYFFDRESMNFFLTDPTGIKLFIFSVGMIFVGTLILRQMLKMRF